MGAGLEWLRRQSWVTRLIMSLGFASISAFAWFWARQIWPWGIVMAILPWIFRGRASDEEDFFREAKPTEDAPISTFCVAIKDGAELEARLSGVAAQTKSGLGADKIKLMVDALAELKVIPEKRFQFVVIFEQRPCSLQFILRRAGSGETQLEIVGDAQLIHLTQ